MNKKPKFWIVIFLGIVFPPAAMMYVAQIMWAGIYLFLALALSVGNKFFIRETVLALGLQLCFIFLVTNHAMRIARRYSEERVRPKYSRWYGVLGSVVGVFAVFLLIRAFFFEPFRHPSGSMSPTISPGGHIVVQKWGYGNYAAFGVQFARAQISSSLNRGEIFVFEFPQDRSVNYVQRLIGLPGDSVVFRGRTLAINGQTASLRQNADYINPETFEARPSYTETLMGHEYSILFDDIDLNKNLPKIDFPFRDACTFHSDGLTCTVPAGHYFMLGDNRDNSNDSRLWGFVPAEHLVGRVVYVSK